MTLNNAYKFSLVQNNSINFDIYSFVGIVKTYYDLPPVVEDRIINILEYIDTKYHLYFGNIPYELVVLGITLFAVDEFNKHRNDSPPFDVSLFIVDCYGVENVRNNVTQTYQVYMEIKEMFKPNNGIYIKTTSHSNNSVNV